MTKRILGVYCTREEFEQSVDADTFPAIYVFADGTFIEVLDTKTHP